MSASSTATNGHHHHRVNHGVATSTNNESGPPPLTKNSHHRNNNNNNDIPLTCRYWCYISNHVIPTYVPFHRHIQLLHCNVTLTLVSALVLSLIRYGAEYLLLVSLFDWPYNSYITKNAAASVAAIFHSIQLVPCLFVCFRVLPRLSVTTTTTTTANYYNNYNPSQHMAVVSQMWWKDTVDALLQFCTGYMIYDGVLNILYLKGNVVGQITTEDCIFLGHHLATILYMSSVRYLQQGHQSAMICMLLGELTNPFHNLYYIATAAQTLPCCNGTISTWLYHCITLAFAVSYVLVRTVVGPVVFVHLTVNLWTTGRRKDEYPIPVALLFLWTILIWGVILGSVPWIVECYHMVQTYRMDSTPLLYYATTTTTTMATAGVETQEL